VLLKKSDNILFNIVLLCAAEFKCTNMEIEMKNISNENQLLKKRIAQLEGVVPSLHHYGVDEFEYLTFLHRNVIFLIFLFFFFFYP
jgi:hypothetical protein